MKKIRVLSYFATIFIALGGLNNAGAQERSALRQLKGSGSVMPPEAPAIYTISSVADAKADDSQSVLLALSAIKDINAVLAGVSETEQSDLKRVVAQVELAISEIRKRDLLAAEDPRIPNKCSASPTDFTGWEWCVYVDDIKLGQYCWTEWGRESKARGTAVDLALKKRCTLVDKPKMGVIEGFKNAKEIIQNVRTSLIKSRSRGYRQTKEVLAAIWVKVDQSEELARSGN